MSPDSFEIVVGLEVHAQLLTQSKLFSSESTAFGAAPNTQTSPITLGHPGTLPRVNRRAVELALKMGMACHCSLEPHSYFARKNYFYPDLPKGYQISQHRLPLCGPGWIRIGGEEGPREIRIARIHLEEDAGKSLHDLDPEFSCIDFNRAGIPLIEIVTEPDLHSGKEAAAYLTELRRLVRWLEVCDGNMEEGSMRCDANISLRYRGARELGTKVEVKNMNSIRHVNRAIEAEARRQYGILEAGGSVRQETRSFDAGKGESFPMRAKETADDYRYFPEPDLAPLDCNPSWLEAIRSSLPELPEARTERYIASFGLSPYDARGLSEDRDTGDYFDSVLSLGADPKATANWILGPVKSWLNEHPGADIPLPAPRLAELTLLVQEGSISFSAASARVLPELLRDPEATAIQVAHSLDLIQDRDQNRIEALVDEVLGEMKDKVLEYRKGKKGLIGLFVGEVMKKSGGNADPELTREMLEKKLRLNN
ncbi:MAG TPA: Asp-tRNA(Asn)/Glu-tRNA(Gln) amidotransferase subunit GatB [Chitinophagaceae bacterium]|nr:Asp-tRNA(Asn)/Glu-tRNA(Gln) amidotransferase subunit GatB [Chitinophagaceae bacterium]